MKKIIRIHLIFLYKKIDFIFKYMITNKTLFLNIYSSIYNDIVVYF